MKKAKIASIITLILYFVCIILKFILVPHGYSPLFKGLTGLAGMVLILFAFIHAAHSLRKKIILFFLIAFITGLAIESIGVTTGFPYGTYYYTSILPVPKVFGLVPLVIPIQWFVYMYICYSVINYIFSRERKNLPLLTIFLLVCSYGICTTAIDMILDPLAVYAGFWVWTTGGPFYGIPIENFTGWFLTAFLATFIFLIYESRISKAEILKDDFLPTICYFLIFLNFTSDALVIRHPEYALIGAASMLPFIIISLIVFRTKS